MNTPFKPGGAKTPVRFSLFNNPFIQQNGPGILGAAGTAAGLLATNSWAKDMALSNVPDVVNQQAQSSGDMFNSPVYNLGKLHTNIQDISNADTNVNEGAMALGGLSQGAAAGSAFGLPGTIIGGVVGGLTSLFGGMSAEEEATAKKKAALEKATAQLRTAQDNFNTQNTSANRNRLAYEQYLQMLS